MSYNSPRKLRRQLVTLSLFAETGEYHRGLSDADRPSVQTHVGTYYQLCL